MATQVELFDNLPSAKGDKKVLRDLKDRERTTIVPPHFVYVQNTEQMHEAAQAIQAVGEMVFDTETTGLLWRDYAVALGVGCMTPTGFRAWWIPTHMVYALRNFTYDEIRDVLGDVFENDRIRKIAHNIKFDMHRMKNNYKIDVRGAYHDTVIAQKLLNENESHTLDDIAHTWLGKKSWKIKQDGKFNVWPLKIATNYLCNDIQSCYEVYKFQVPHLEERPKLHSLMYDKEMPNVLEAYDMEQRGIAYDMTYHNEVLAPEVEGHCIAAQKRVQDVLGPINLDAPGQVSVALFDGLGLPRIEGDSVNKKVLARLRKVHPVIVDLEEYRKYSTLRKMFVQELPDHVVGGRIHPNFNTYGTKTGRYSCTDPNLQQLPKASVGPLIRRAFVPSEGHVLVTMDYSQIELRILAHISGDENLTRAFESGEDVHTATCLLMFPTQITHEELIADKDHPLRVRAKTINFGILYGMGPMLLMDTINGQTKREEDKITLDQAKELIEQWYAAFPKVKKYINRMKTLAFKQGYVETILGRKRRLPDARHADRAISSMAERQAVNSPIQGSAADMLKVAAIKIRDFIRNNNYPYRLLLQIHDELVFEVPAEWLKRNKATLNALSGQMRDAIKLDVPVKVSVDILTRWGDKVHDDAFDMEEAA